MTTTADIEPVHFLLVDDLEENLMALDALLRRPGLVLHKARTGAEALELLLAHDIALALVDVQMPGMDGFMLAEAMRGSQRTRRVPIIFLTAGAADRQRRFRGYEAGAVDFLQKPIESDVVLSKAQVFFDLCRQRQEVARLLDETRRGAEALKEADRRKDEFLAMLAHELRNPLAPIRNAVQILRQSSANGEHAQTIAMMERQLGQMVRLVDDLLDVSRVSRGKIELRKEPVALTAVVSQAVEAASELVQCKSHELTVTLPAQPVYIDGDPARLAQVIGNLVNNACKFTDKGGKITLTTERDGNHIEIHVGDNGIGIAETHLPRIFDMFMQVDTSLERTASGLGIGLMLVKKLVELHGGSVRVHSKGIGHGSEFVLRLPVLDVAPQAQTAPATRAPETTRPRRILVVDDNADSALSLAMLLRLTGNETHTVHDGLAAVDAAQSFKPEVVLLDIGLPGLNGYDACRRIREIPAGKKMLIVALTGWGQADDRQKSRDAGFDSHLVKPVDHTALMKLLDGLER